MLSDKIKTLPASAPVLSQEIVKFALNITTAKSLNDVAREHGVFKEIKVLKKNFLKASEYTLSKLWKVAVRSTEKQACKNCSFRRDCKKLGTINAKNCPSFTLDKAFFFKKYQVSTEDIDLILSLSKKDKQKIQKKFGPRLNKAGNFTLDDVYEDLREWCYKLVWRKFKFIVKYYWDLEIDDIVNELLVEGQLRALECETMTDKLHFTNAIKRRIKQRAVNLIDFYTAGPRRRFENVKGDLNKQLDFYANRMGLGHLSQEQKEKRFKHAIDSEFQVKTLSIDFQQIDDEEEGSSTLHGILGVEAKGTEKFENKEFLDQILEKISDEKQKRMVKILLGVKNKKFDAYLLKANIKADANQCWDEKYLAKLAEYFEVDVDVFQEKLTKILLSLKIINSSNISRLANLKPTNTALQLAKL